MYKRQGSAFAKRLSGFECRVLAYDKYKTEQSEFAKMVEMEIIFKEADIVSFHLPLTPETHFLVRDEYLARFSKDIFIINTSRGKVVKTTGLISALKSGKVRGAVLDVFENEHLDTFSEADKSWFKELTTIPQVILTPHVAGWTHESKQRIAEVLVEKLTQHGF